MPKKKSTEERARIARGTRVRTPAGWEPIERLEKGDEVLAWDHESSRYVLTHVTKTKKAKSQVIALAVNDMRLRMTSDSPVWSPEAEECRSAEEWIEGELNELLRATRGTKVVDITDRLRYDGVAEVYDIDVEHDLGNFVVDGFVVHTKPNAAPV